MLAKGARALDSSWNLALVSPAAPAGLTCVDCGRPVSYIKARTPYERLIRARQINHRLCERCARTTVEVGADLDGLRRKSRFLGY